MRFRNSSGFTLIEIMVVVGIMALAYGSVLLFGFGGHSMMRQELTRLMQRIRYVYHLASTENRYYRIVFNLDDNSYFVEVSDDPIFVQTEKSDEEKSVAQEMDELSNDDAEEKEKNFYEADNDLLEKTTLDEDIRIYSIFVEHQKDRYYEGVVYLNFFPRGQTEFAVLQLTDAEESRFMTLQLNPTTGSLEVYDELKNHEDILEELQR